MSETKNSEYYQQLNTTTWEKAEGKPRVRQLFPEPRAGEDILEGPKASEILGRAGRVVLTRTCYVDSHVNNGPTSRRRVFGERLEANTRLGNCDFAIEGWEMAGDGPALVREVEDQLDKVDEGGLTIVLELGTIERRVPRPNS